MTIEEVTVETSEPEPEPESESPDVVVVESEGAETVVEPVRAEHDSRHADHEARHDRESSEMRQVLGELVAGVHNINERLDSMENRVSSAESSAIQAEVAAEEVKEEIEEAVVESETQQQAVEVTEPEPDIAASNKPHVLRRLGW